MFSFLRVHSVTSRFKGRIFYFQSARYDISIHFVIFICSVKLNDLSPHRCHRASLCNGVWGRGSYIILFSPGSHSKRFSVTSLRLTEYIQWSVILVQSWQVLEVIYHLPPQGSLLLTASLFLDLLPGRCNLLLSWFYFAWFMSYEYYISANKTVI